MNWGRYNVTYVVFPKYNNLNLLRKQSHESKLRTIVQNKWPGLLRKVNVTKEQTEKQKEKGLGICFRF